MNWSRICRPSASFDAIVRYSCPHRHNRRAETQADELEANALDSFQVLDQMKQEMPPELSLEGVCSDLHAGFPSAQPVALTLRFIIFFAGVDDNDEHDLYILIPFLPSTLPITIARGTSVYLQKAFAYKG